MLIFLVMQLSPQVDKPLKACPHCRRFRLQSIIAKAVRYGYLPRSFCTLDELREDSDEKLFFSARPNPFHVLHRLLLQSKNVSYNLRQRTHNLTLPTGVNAVMKQNFVFRMLFTDIYWLSVFIILCIFSTVFFFLLYCLVCVCHISLKNLLPKTATVAEKYDCRRKVPFLRRFRRQPPFSATVALFCNSRHFLRQCGQGLSLYYGWCLMIVFQ